MHTGDRLKEERERLGFNQTDFAAIADATRKTLFNWETGIAAPNALVLAAWAERGLDVLYVVTGLRDPNALDPAEQALIDSYRRCKPAARVNLIQTAALLSAGMSAASPKQDQGIQVGNISQRSTHAGTVQVGAAGGNVRVKK